MTDSYAMLEKTAEIEDTFSYDGYQIARREMFAHLREPAVTIRKDSITFNTACINGLEDVVYIQILVNSEDHRLAIRECDENDQDAIRWCIAKPDKRKTRKITSKPFHYISSDGYDIFVGKNNYQNEELTFKVASGNDWWFHAKGIPGSHVIVKSNGQTDLPDRVFEEAGALAAYYSKGRENDKVEIDYIQKKNIKKVAGAAPGFVIYHTNYSLVASPRCDLKEVK